MSSGSTSKSTSSSSRKGHSMTGQEICAPDGSNGIKKYTVLGSLGAGGFATVFKVKSQRSGRIFALKRIEKASIKTAKHEEKLRSEIRIHALVGKDNIFLNKYVVPFDRFWSDSHSIYITMRHCSNGSLEQWLKHRRTVSEPEALHCVEQIALGVKYMHHEHRVIHRDLKLGNLLFDSDMKIKICDFGLAAQLSSEQTKKFTMCGTPNYIAPEIASGIHNKVENHGHSFEVDVWAIGVIFYTLIYGVPPFQTNDIQSTCTKIRKSQFSYPEKPKLSDLSKQAIRQILAVDIEQRLSITGILNHACLKESRIPKKLPSSVLKRTPSEADLFGDADATTSSSTARSPPSQQHDHSKGGSNSKENQAPGFHGLGAPAMAAAASNSSSSSGKKYVNVVKFIDYSQKYGVGYVLSNGFTGVLFNDNSAMLMDYKKEFIFTVADVRKHGKCAVEKHAFAECTSSASQHSQAMKKRLHVFIGISKAIWNNFQSVDFNAINADAANNADMQQDPLFVVHWTRTDYAAIFTLNQSRPIVQSIFKDNTLVTISMNVAPVQGKPNKHKLVLAEIILAQYERNVFQHWSSFTQFKAEARSESKQYIQHIIRSTPIFRSTPSVNLPRANKP